MINKLSGWDDTIVAVSTAPGIGAIAVIRISGTNAFEIINELFPSKDIIAQPSHTLHVGVLYADGMPVDEVVLALFKGPKSFTGEDTIEISCHGSPFVQQQVLDACIQKGARLARAGEFTQRAFLNGKMDLTQAEAVADIIASNSKASQQTALHNIRGGFSHDLQNMREQLLQFAALIELELDFATEDVEFADRKKFYALIETLQASTAKLLQSFQLGNVIKNGVSVAIIGKPNAGKSTLLNTLLNEERAIVSDIAGTTRDTIEEMLNIRGVLFRLIDTAGIRTHASDKIESIGIERSKENAARADIIVEVLDITSPDDDDDQEWMKLYESKTIVVLNKYDAWLANNEKKNKDVQINTPHILLSANDGYGIEALKNEIYNKAIGTDINTENTIITNARHYEALQQVQQSLNDIKTGLDTGLPGDLLALDIRRCLYYLGEITGEVSNEDKLDYIFSKFCIGK